MDVGCSQRALQVALDIRRPRWRRQCREQSPLTGGRCRTYIFLALSALALFTVSMFVTILLLG